MTSVCWEQSWALQQVRRYGDSPGQGTCPHASPNGQIQSMRCSVTECSKGCSAWWEQPHSRAQGTVVLFLT